MPRRCEVEIERVFPERPAIASQPEGRDDQRELKHQRAIGQTQPFRSEGALNVPIPQGPARGHPSYASAQAREAVDRGPCQRGGCVLCRSHNGDKQQAEQESGRGFGVDPFLRPAGVPKVVAPRDECDRRPVPRAVAKRHPHAASGQEAMERRTASARARVTVRGQKRRLSGDSGRAADADGGRWNAPARRPLGSGLMAWLSRARTRSYPTG